MAKIPVLDAVRIIPRDADFLDRKSGNRGEIFYDRDANSLRLYDGISAGGACDRPARPSVSGRRIRRNNARRPW